MEKRKDEKKMPLEISGNFKFHYEDTFDVIRIKDLHLRCIVGVNEWERREKQDIILNIEIWTDKLKKAGRSDDISDTIDYKKIKYGIVKIVEGSSPYLIEKLSFDVAKFCITQDDGIKMVKVEVDKPGALRFARSVSVEIKMDKKEHFVSVGSNINPEENIKEALKIISEIEELKISAISSFYETPPLNSKGEIDNSQPKFINGVIKVVSFLEESEVQAIFEEIERKMGRIKSPETKFAPREIDLDVILSISFDGKIRYIHTDVFEKFFILPCVFEIDKRTIFLIRNFITESVIGDKFNFEEELNMFRSYAVKLPEFSEDVKNFLNKRV